MTKANRVRTVHLIPAERYTRNLHVAAYVRVSSKKGSQDESYETQAKYYESLIKANPKWDFVGVYGDKQSGIHTKNRPEFQKMMEDALNRKIDLILCKSVSRWSRNIVDGLRTVNLLRDHFVYVVFEQEGIDTERFGSTLMLNMSMAIAQTESESTSDNLKWLYRRRAEQGKFVAHKGKYFGYNTDDGSFTPNDDAKYVRMIYKNYLDGQSMTQIADELNAKGLRTTAGLPWGRGSVRNILTNEVYVGDVRLQKRPSRNVITGIPDERQIDAYLCEHHEGIISRRTWNAVKRSFAKRKKTKQGAGQKLAASGIDEDVLALVQEGWSGPRIAEFLDISIDQEKGSVRRLKAQGKLADRSYESVDDRVEAIGKLLESEPGITNKAIGERLGLKRHQVDYALKKLRFNQR